jgi:hypothetical protein
MEEKLKKPKLNRLAKECAKLDPAFEKAMAEEGMGEEMEQWPEYQEGRSAPEVLCRDKL